MRVVANLAQEFVEVCTEYSKSTDQQGKDVVTLVTLFGDKYDGVRSHGIPDFRAAWAEFLEEHKHQMTVVPMVGLILYTLITYWEDGQIFAVQLPTLERMLVRDTVSDISDEIHRRSEAHGSSVLVVPE